MSKKITIMHINYTMDTGGIESFIMNVIRTIDMKHFKIVILTYSNNHYDYEDEIIGKGITIRRIENPKNISTPRHIQQIKRVIEEEKVDVVHSHTYFNSAFVLIAARLAGVGVRITHSHTALALSETNVLKMIKNSIARLLIMGFATQKIACSHEAGRALFGNQKFTIIPNGIDLKAFQFDKKWRRSLRSELDIDNQTIAIGHIGRFDTPKNHSFLIDIFDEYQKAIQNSVLILAGTGKLLQSTQEKVRRLGIEDKVIFLGNRSDVSHLLSAFDYLVFPSIYEGLPVSLVEAQANGLDIYASTAVSPEVKLTDKLRFFLLTDGAKKWASRIGTTTKYQRPSQNTRQLQAYGIENTVKQLIRLYGVKNV